MGEELEEALVWQQQLFRNMYEACDCTAETCAFHVIRFKKCNNSEIQFCVVLFLAHLLVVWRKYYDCVIFYAS